MEKLVTNCYDCLLRECSKDCADTCYITGEIVKRGKPTKGECPLDKNDFIIKKK